MAFLLICIASSKRAYTACMTYRVARYAVGFTVTQRKLALGGESLRFRDVALPRAHDWALTGRLIMPSKPSNLWRSDPCAPAALNWRSVYGLAVAAACFVYRRCRLWGVAAPGLLVLLISPPCLRTEATNSVQEQASSRTMEAGVYKGWRLRLVV